MNKNSTNKTIAKNTFFLYIRMMVTMIISLFTSRVILQTLGIDDYGIYQAVGGIVGFMSFLNSALSTGSSRFLTFALGKGQKEETKNTFSTVLIVHIALAILVIIIAETIGLWFLYNKMVIPMERMTAAIWVYHLSIITAAINITQVPYSGCITAHERFNLYAYVSIVEAILKLLIVYMLYIGTLDKLILYAILYFVVQFALQMFYRWYCLTRFEECKFRLVFDKKIFLPIASFSGWSLISNITIALNNQGVLILLNMFFSPAIVAARALSLQVDGVIKQFVNNFRTASNPQIIKSYASGDREGSKRLLIQTSNWAFFLMLILSTPICVVANPLLNLWLEKVPDYTVIFLQLIVIQNLFGVLDACFFTAFSASGRLKENALISPLVNAIRFIAIYFFFKAGASPLALSYAGIITNLIISCGVKPLLMIKYLDYHWNDFMQVFLPCIKVLIPVIILSAIIYKYSYIGNFPNIALNILVPGLLTFMITVAAIWVLGLKQSEKQKIELLIKSKLHRN